MSARAEQGRQTLDAVEARQKEVEKIVRSVNVSYSASYLLFIYAKYL
jgi:hypothetical protein